LLKLHEERDAGDATSAAISGVTRQIADGREKAPIHSNAASIGV
jgi:hypothetical protein